MGKFTSNVLLCSIEPGLYTIQYFTLIAASMSFSSVVETEYLLAS